MLSDRLWLDWFAICIHQTCCFVGLLTFLIQRLDLTSRRSMLDPCRQPHGLLLFQVSPDLDPAGGGKPCSPALGAVAAKTESSWSQLWSLDSELELRNGTERGLGRTAEQNLNGFLLFLTEMWIQSGRTAEWFAQQPASNIWWVISLSFFLNSCVVFAESSPLCLHLCEFNRYPVQINKLIRLRFLHFFLLASKFYSPENKNPIR